MKIKNINDAFGDPIEFDSLDEMQQAILDCGYELPEDGLKENRDYEIISQNNEPEILWIDDGF